MDIISGRFDRVLAGNGRVIISSSTGGTSATWSIPQDLSDGDLIQIAEMAMQILESEDGEQVANHNRILTFGQFSGIRR